MLLVIVIVLLIKAMPGAIVSDSLLEDLAGWVSSIDFDGTKDSFCSIIIGIIIDKQMLSKEGSKDKLLRC